MPLQPHHLKNSLSCEILGLIYKFEAKFHKHPLDNPLSIKMFTALNHICNNIEVLAIISIDVAQSLRSLLFIFWHICAKRLKMTHRPRLRGRIGILYN
jgi:hypothetical protein